VKKANRKEFKTPFIETNALPYVTIDTLFIQKKLQNRR